MAKPFQYRFAWDLSKARQNLKDHKIAFERAAQSFLIRKPFRSSTRTIVRMKIGG